MSIHAAPRTYHFHINNTTDPTTAANTIRTDVAQLLPLHNGLYGADAIVVDNVIIVSLRIAARDRWMGQRKAVAFMTTLMRRAKLHQHTAVLTAVNR